MSLAPDQYGPPDPNADPLDHIDHFLGQLSPDELAHIDELFGVQHPALDTTTEKAPKAGVGEQIVSSLAGAGQGPQARARSFGEGLVQGGIQGLGSAGTRAQASRAKLEAGIATRQAERDKANSEATAAYRAAQGRAGQAVGSALLGDALTRARQQTPEQIKADATARAAGEAAGNPGKTTAQIRAEAQARAAGEAAGKASGTPVTGPSADSVYKVPALQYIRTGNYPRGLLGPDERQPFLAYVNANFPKADIAKNAAQYKSDAASLAKQQANLDQVTTSSNTLSTSIQNLRGVMDNVPDTGVPAANGIVRGVAQMFGNEAVPQYNQALHVVQNESSRILGGDFHGGGAIHESEKKDIKAVQSGNFTRQQLAHVIDIVESDKIGRLNAGRKQLNTIKNRLDYADSGQDEKPQDANWYGTIQQQGAHYSVTDPNGKVHPFTSRAQANNFIENANNALGY